MSLAMASGMRTLRTSLLALLLGLAACATDLDIEDGAADDFGGKADGGLDEGSTEARGVLALVNDPAVDADELDLGAGLSKRAATNIVAARPFATLAALDAVAYVGPKTLEALLDYARATGRVVAAARIDAVFSPQPLANTHTARIAAMIRAAHATIDIAMYSFSNTEISTALADAVARGVDVRFLFQTASDDRKLPLESRPDTASGRLERAGVDVRWVNKILHHKVAVIDGESVVTGSANWSFGGAQVFDENTLFVEGSPELAAAYTREFELLWSHSTDFTLGTAQPLPTARAVPATADDPDVEALFTSANFTVAAGSPTFRVDRARTSMADALVAAIGRATRSIHIASGHLRLRPVAEALIAAHAAHPELDIRVYLDQQEFISASGDSAQRAELATCLAAATTESQRWSCSSNDFLFGKQVGDAGIDVRYKTYAYRWDYSYAVQMHDKYVVIDGAELFTGSYNLSMNSEQATFENVLHLRGPSHVGLIAAFERDFDRLWTTGRTPDRLAALQAQIAGTGPVPLVFESMALDWRQVTDLKAALRAACAPIDSAEYRENPAAHRTCPR
jgi:phosphatidylserine/phosphatidylglycerophosphate/cardiolipin synthase-like enzyme